MKKRFFDEQTKNIFSSNEKIPTNEENKFKNFQRTKNLPLFLSLRWF